MAALSAYAFFAGGSEFFVMELLGPLLREAGVAGRERRGRLYGWFETVFWAAQAAAPWVGGWADEGCRRRRHAD